MRHFLLSACLVLLTLLTHAQNPNRVTVKGRVVDTTSVSLPFATVMLLTPKDSALVSYARCDEKGAFEIKNVKRGTYLVKTSFMGYLPYQREFTPGDGAVTDLGELKMKAIAKELFEVVVKTAKAPLNIRGDTIEYNASSFKVPPGSTVEDLLKRLPGFQVDQDGSIRAQGQEVKRVTVDGKNFFGGDPKTAIKNLGAETIDKVQVYNSQSEQSKATGIDDGKKEKTVNLALKDEYKKGGFGKIKAGGGTDERVDVRGNYNRFDDKRQFAVVGLGNNINQSGMSWDDRQDFYGSSAFRWDNVDFGFGGGIGSGSGYGGNFYSGGGQDRGFNNSYAGGLNYNFETKKRKFSSNYYYSQRRNWMDQVSKRQSILSDNSYETNTNSNDYSKNDNHSIQVRYEDNLDSLNTLILLGNGTINNTDGTSKSVQENFRGTNALTNRSTQDNGNDTRNYNFSGSALFRHKFRQKGKTFSASASYILNSGKGDATQRSLNEFFASSTGYVPPKNLDLLNSTSNKLNQFKVNLSFVQPITKRVSWESFYNFGVRNDEVDRDVYNRLEGNQRNDTLSRYYTNQIMHNRLGTSLRYNHKGLNISAGLAGIRMDLESKFASDQSKADFTRLNRDYTLFVPSAGLNFDLKKNRYLYVEYSGDVQQPSVRDLQPIIDYSNPLVVTQGNPDLKPTVAHNSYGGYSYFNPASFARLFINANYTYYSNQVVYNQTVDSLLITHSKPANVSGGQNVGTYVSFGFPLKKNKANIGFNTSANFGQNYTLVNDIRNRTNNNNYRFGVNLDLTPSENFTFYGNANWAYNDVNYSINTTQNQKIWNINYNGQMNVKMPWGLYFNTTFNYAIYKNDRFDLNQNIPILNMALYKLLGKTKRSEIRLSGYDILRKNQGITQTATSNYFVQTQVRTITQYFMLSYTFNMRGITAKMRRDGFSF
ncbi:outer membrane beta-barrel protein [Siphonobacter aquaeclarae]|uniref:Outer membrane receptor proteins, mostly Fe transport n=1 Tax=Siphonobacter aquaeclarae TaxID=563176 RepID=A0A1G9WXH2_9BACT|nr:outer membrane beta-barrel protein [Siphonobacter aquaeclarae]SDM89129.1 Outer membrane receptor proteins, mostly Fe transport [Siphonobacter aquaeclarae]